MREIAIRPATLQDLDAIFGLLEQVDRVHVAAAPEVFQEFAGPPRPRALIAEKIEGPDSDYLVAEEEGAVVAFLSLWKASHPHSPMFRPHEFVLVENLVVEERCRREGIGSALLNAACGWAQQRGLRHLQLTVWAANTTAVAFYEKHGFRTLHQRMEREL